MNSQSSLNKVLKNAGILLSGNMGANIFGLLSIAIFTHSQGAVIFGYYVLFLTFIDILDKIFNFQTWQAFIKFSTDFQVRNENHNIMMLLKYSFLVDLLSLLVASLVALSISPYMMSFFEIPAEYYTLLLLMSLTILFKITEISTGVFRLFNEFKVQAKIAVYSAFIKFLLFGLVALLSPSFKLFIYATVLSQFITMLLKFFYAKKIFNKNNFKLMDIVRENINMPLMKELKIFSFIIYKNFSVAIRMISRQLDVVILGKLYGAEIVGIYKIAKDVANLIARFTDPIYQSIYPEFARLIANHKQQEAKDMAIKISIYAGASALIFYVLFILFGEWAVRLMFGAEFIEAYPLTLVYYIAIFIAIVSLPLVPLMDSSGLVKHTFMNQFYATSIYILIIYPLIDYYSAIGACLAYIVYYICWVLFAIKSIYQQNKTVI